MNCKECKHEKESADVEKAVYWCSKCVHNGEMEDNFDPIKLPKYKDFNCPIHGKYSSLKPKCSVCKEY